MYDFSKFAINHPGGQKYILQNAGFDGTRDYEEGFHSEEDQEKLRDYYIGKFDMKTYPKVKDAYYDCDSYERWKRILDNEYTYEEIAQHNSQKSCWIVVKD